MGIRSQKTEVGAILRNRDRAALIEWAQSVRNPFRVLVSMTYDGDELVRWRAIEATGWVVGAQAVADLDRARDMLRRLFWQMNDESGGLTWHSPELIAEILVNVPELISEYAQMLPSFFHEEPFERGAHIAAYRIAMVKSEAFAECISDLSDSTGDSDPIIRAFAVLTLGALGATQCRDVIERLREDESEMRCYDFESGKLVSRRVSEAAQAALDAINSKERAA